MDATDSKSSKLLILLVAWRFNAKANSGFEIPKPSSSTLIKRTPPACKRTVMPVDCASNALSTNSLTTDEGRSTTSPAAIWLMSSCANSAMGRLSKGETIKEDELFTCAF
jgi:hypothetical protein